MAEEMDTNNCTLLIDIFNGTGIAGVGNQSGYCGENANDVNVYIPRGPPPPSTTDIVLAIVMGIICIVGLLGNGLVIFVIARYAKMKTVTNIYIMNLSIADALFLVGLPMAITTSIIKYWIFGEILCKMYYILTCINQFTGAFTLTMMSADRFIAVRYPIRAMNIRTSRYATVSLLVIWSISLLFIIPIVLFSKLTVISEPYSSCQIMWPAKHAQTGQKVYVLYTLLLGFAIPVYVITVLYTLLIVRLRRKSRALGVSSKKRSHATKVTKLVTIIISVFILCWLPYWAFQAYLIATIPRTTPLSPIMLYLFQAFTMLSYANSMVNPILYAFTNESFRDSFNSVFKCINVPMRSKSHSVHRRGSECGSLVIGNRNERTGHTTISTFPTKIENHRMLIMTNSNSLENGNEMLLDKVNCALNSN